VQAGKAVIRVDAINADVRLRPMTEKTYTAQTAATELGITDSRVRQICIESWEDFDRIPIGRDHAGTWFLTEEDIGLIREQRSRQSKHT